MEVWHGRRIMTGCIVFILSFVLCAVLPFSYFCLTGAAFMALAALLTLLLWKKNKAYRLFYPIFLSLAFIAGGFCSASYRYSLEERFTTAQEQVFTGTVQAVEREENYAASYRIAVNGEGKHTVLCLAESDMPLSLQTGDEVELIATPQPITDTYYLSDGVRVLLDVSAASVLREGDGTEKFWLALNRRCPAILYDRLGAETGAFAGAVLLGNRNAIDASVRLAFRRIGFSHVLAVSGLHLSVILSFFSCLWHYVTVSGRIRRLLLVPCVVLLIGITGAPASVLRASLMFFFAVLADLLHRDGDTPTALFAAVAFLLCVNPASLYDIGLWLSFLATLGIVLVSPYLQKLQKKTKSKKWKARLSVKARNGLALGLISLVTSFFTLPVLFLCYGGVSLVAPLASLLLIPLVSFLLPLFLVVLLLGFIKPLLFFLRPVCRILTGFLLAAAEYMSDWDGVYLSLSYPFTRLFVLLSVLVLLLLFFGRRFRIRHAVLCLLCLSLGFGISVAGYEKACYPVVQTAIVNRKADDMFAFRYHGSCVVVDVSGGSYASARQCTDAVSDLCEDRINTLVLTHLHLYHAKTLKKLSANILVDCVLYPAPQTEAEIEYEAALLAVAQAQGITAVSYYEKASIFTDDFCICLPDTLYINRSSHRVIAFSAEKEGETLLCYYGASYNELKDTKETADAFLHVYGSHGPKIRSAFSTRAPALVLGSACESADGAYDVLADGTTVFAWEPKENKTSD